MILSTFEVPFSGTFVSVLSVRPPFRFSDCSTLTFPDETNPLELAVLFSKVVTGTFCRLEIIKHATEMSVITANQFLIMSSCYLRGHLFWTISWEVYWSMKSCTLLPVGCVRLNHFSQLTEVLGSQGISLLCEYVVFCSDTKPTVAAVILPFFVTSLNFLFVLHLEAWRSNFPVHWFPTKTLSECTVKQIQAMWLLMWSPMRNHRSNHRYNPSVK